MATHISQHHTHARRHNGHAHHAHRKIAAFTLGKAKTRITRATTKLSKRALEAQEKLQDMQKDLTVYVKKNPLRSVGYSVLAGIAVAQALRILRKIL